MCTLPTGSGGLEEEGCEEDSLTREEGKRGEGVGVKEEQAVMTYYKRGVYLDRDATLKDLRNAFLDSGTYTHTPEPAHTSLGLGRCTHAPLHPPSHLLPPPLPTSSGQLEEDNRLFQFLKSDVPGDTVAIETEEETFLSELEPNLVEPRTIFFQLLEHGGMGRVEGGARWDGEGGLLGHGGTGARWDGEGRGRGRVGYWSTVGWGGWATGARWDGEATGARWDGEGEGVLLGHGGMGRGRVCYWGTVGWGGGGWATGARWDREGEGGLLEHGGMGRGRVGYGGTVGWGGGGWATGARWDGEGEGGLLGHGGMGTVH